MKSYEQKKKEPKKKKVLITRITLKKSYSRY